MAADTFDAIVLSGGGTKGILTLGALHYFYETKRYNPSDIKEYAGTSIGAAICLLLICGYTPMDIFSEIYEKKSFFNTKGGGMWAIIQNMGLMSIGPFSEFIGELVKRKLGSVPTFSALKVMTGKILSISGANVSKMVEMKYSPSTTPHMSCVEAVKISCSLPVIFQRIKHKGNYVVDGGLLNNFPRNYISKKMKMVLGVVLIGHNISASDDSFVGYFFRLLMLPINQLTELRCRECGDDDFIIRVKWKGIALLQLTMTHEQKLEMFLSGYNASKRRSDTKLISVDGWSFYDEEPDGGDGWEWENIIPTYEEWLDEG